MTRDYRRIVRGRGIVVPRPAIGLALFAALCWIGWRIMNPPAWTVQRLDSPDGRRAALLLRHHYLRDSFSVKLKHGWLWRTYFYSGSVTNDYRTDLDEHLRWTEDSRRLFLYVTGEPWWGYDFDRQAALSPDAAPPARPGR